MEGMTFYIILGIGALSIFLFLLMFSRGDNTKTDENQHIKKYSGFVRGPDGKINEYDNTKNTPSYHRPPEHRDNNIINQYIKRRKSDGYSISGVDEIYLQKKNIRKELLTNLTNHHCPICGQRLYYIKRNLFYCKNCKEEYKNHQLQKED